LWRYGDHYGSKAPLLSARAFLFRDSRLRLGRNVALLSVMKKSSAVGQNL
jgi:hypothetical protein